MTVSEAQGPAPGAARRLQLQRRHRLHHGSDPRQRLREANDATHLMVMIESDEACDALDGILAVEGIDMVTVGPMDWAVGLGLFGDEARARQAPKIERVLRTAAAAGRITTAGAFSTEEAEYYRGLGVRVFFVGVDLVLKQQALTRTLSRFRRRSGPADRGRCEQGAGSWTGADWGWSDQSAPSGPSPHGYPYTQ